MIWLDTVVVGQGGFREEASKTCQRAMSRVRGEGG